MVMDEKANATNAVMTVDNASGWSALFGPRYLAATAMLGLNTCLFAFNEFFVTVAMPSAARDFGRPWLLSWAFTLFLVFSIVGGAPAANLKQRFGSRAVLVGATLLFLAGTFLAALASNPLSVMAGRLMQGAGEGVTFAICYALIPEIFPERLVSKVFGIEAVAWAVAAFGAPVSAGFVTQYFSWRWAFALSIPPACLFVLLALAIAPGRVSREPGGPVPLLRLVLVGAGIMAISFAGIAEAIVEQVPLIALAAGLIFTALRIDFSSDHPVLPRHAFSTRIMPGVGLWVILLMPIAGSAGSVYLVYALQAVWGLKPAEASLFASLLALGWSGMAIIAANRSTESIRLKLAWAGPALVASGLSLMTLALITGQFWLVVAAQMLIGIGFGASWGPTSQILMERTPEADRDRVSVLLPTLQSAGYAIGGALFGFVANVAGLEESLGGTAVRVALLPVFAAALFAACLAIAGGWRVWATAASQNSEFEA